MKRALVVVAWTSVVLIMAATIGLLLPRLIAEHYIRQINRRAPEASLGAFRHLERMGRLATPTLLDAALNRDAEIDSLRDKAAPLDKQASDWLSELRDKARSSEIDFRAEVCAVALLKPWNRGWIVEPEQRRLVRYYNHRTIWVRLAACPPDVEYLYAYYHEIEQHGHAGSEELWLKRKLVLLVDGVEQEPAHDNSPGSAWHNYLVAKPDNTPQSFPGSGDRWNGGSKALKVPIPALARGNHSVAVRVLLGPGDRSLTAETEQPPPWFEAIVVGPAEFEIADGAGPVGKKDPTLDQAMKAVLDRRKMFVSQRDGGPLNVEFLPTGAHLPEAMAGDFYLTVDGRRVNFFPAKYRSETRSVSLPMPSRLRLGAGSHTIEMEYVPSLQAAVDMALDSYWAGTYQFRPVQFAIDDNGKLIKPETVGESMTEP